MASSRAGVTTQLGKIWIYKLLNAGVNLSSYASESIEKAESEIERERERERDRERYDGAELDLPKEEAAY